MKHCLLLLALVACVPPQPTPSYYGQGQPQADGTYAAAPAPTGFTCMQLFSCFQGCADGACIQQCLGQADAALQSNANAFMQCGLSKCQNAGGDCIATRSHFTERFAFQLHRFLQ